MTGSAIIKIHDYSGVWDRIPPQIFARFIEFFTSRYDPAACYFEEPYMKQLKKNTADRCKARIQLFSRNALIAHGAWQNIKTAPAFLNITFLNIN